MHLILRENSIFTRDTQVIPERFLTREREWINVLGGRTLYGAMKSKHMLDKIPRSYTLLQELKEIFEKGKGDENSKKSANESLKLMFHFLVAMKREEAQNADGQKSASMKEKRDWMEDFFENTKFKNLKKFGLDEAFRDLRDHIKMSRELNQYATEKEGTWFESFKLYIRMARDMKADQLPLGPWWNSLSESIKKNIDNFFGRYFIEKWVMRANPRDDARWRQFQKRFAKLEPTFQRTEYVFDIYGSDGNIRKKRREFHAVVLAIQTVEKEDSKIRILQPNITPEDLSEKLGEKYDDFKSSYPQLFVYFLTKYFETKAPDSPLPLKLSNPFDSNATEGSPKVKRKPESSKPKSKKPRSDPDRLRTNGPNGKPRTESEWNASDIMPELSAPIAPNSSSEDEAINENHERHDSPGSLQL